MDIWRLPLGGGPPEQLTTDPAGDFSPSPSPDGRTVAFHSLRTGKRDIFIMPAAGGPATQVSHRPGDNMAPGWSPDGQELFWVDLSNRDSLAWRARRSDSAGWETPTPATFGTTLAKPNWSPNGNWVALTSIRGPEVLNLRTGQRRALDIVCCGFQGWSQDGRILYAAGLDPSGRLSATEYAVLQALAQALVSELLADFVPMTDTQKRCMRWGANFGGGAIGVVVGKLTGFVYWMYMTLLCYLGGLPW